MIRDSGVDEFVAHDGTCIGRSAHDMSALLTMQCDMVKLVQTCYSVE